MRRRGKRDFNHSEIVALYRQLAASVVDLGNVGSGTPDLCIGLAGVTDFVEVKNGAGKLTDDQRRFLEAWKGSPVVVVRTLEDVVIHVGNMRKRAR